MKRAIIIFILLIAGMAQMPALRAQEVAVKTNIVSDAFLNVNLGAEVSFATRWSVDLTGDFNSWSFSGGKRWKHWLAQPEARYWFCEALGGHFVGLHALFGQANVGHLDTDFKFLGTDFGVLKNHRYQGWIGGVGLAYGYSWLLGKHWNLEAEIGLGWIHASYDIYECAGCGRRVGTGRPNYVGPTKAAINLVYVF